MSALNIQVRVQNLDRVRAQLQRLSGQQAREAYAKALNDTGFMVRGAMQAQLSSVFDRVTPWVRNSPKVFAATADSLSVAVAPTLTTDYGVFMRGGKVGVDPQDVLQAQEMGGARRDKRSEVMLRRAGFLPAGFQTAIPKTPYPGSDDGRGNLRGPFLQQVLSYLQAYSEQGHKQNMTKKRMAGIRKGTEKTTGRRYFVSLGRYRDATRHIAPGIWAASGTHDVILKPVVLFVRKANYRPRLDMAAIVKKADAQDYLDRRVRYRVRQAAEGLG